MDLSRDDAVFAEKLAMFYRNNLLAVCANVLIAILMVVALRERLPERASNI